MEYNYFLMDRADLTPEIRRVCVETVFDAELRISTEATPRVMLKFLGVRPASLPGYAVVLSRAEVGVELDKPEWNPEAEGL